MIDTAKIAVCAGLSIPAGYFVGVLVDRIPDALPLREDLPGPRFVGKYLAGHLVTLAVFVLIAIRFSDESWITLAPLLVFATGTIALSIIDIETYRLPDRLVLGTFLSTLLLICVASIVDGNAKAIQWALLGSLLFFGFLLIFHLIFGNKGLGFGDVKAAAIFGLVLGWTAGADFRQVLTLVIWSILIAFTISAVLGLVLWVTRGRSRSYPIGPFLVFGTMAAIFFRSPILFG